MSEGRVQIERLAYGAHGVARHDGKVLFVRSTAPGDVVEFRVDEDHGSYAYASADRIVEASPVRRSPPCAYLPRCGGCPWQHVTYEAQLAAKEENVREHLHRIAGLASPPLLPILRSPLEFGYRSRLSLRTDNGHIGFYAANTHDLVEVDRCLLGGEVVNDALPHAASLVGDLRSSVRRIELIQCTVPTAESVAFVGEVEGDLADVDEATVLRFLAEVPLVRGVVLHGRGWRRSWGDEVIEISPQDGLRLTARSGAFTQVNPLGNRLLVERVLALGAFKPSDRVLDLYAGAGNLTFPIARHVARVTAVEQDRIGARAAEENAYDLRVKNVDVMNISARRALSQWTRHANRVDAVVVDPPRSGISDIINLLLDLAPPRLIYVSCNPSTFARDLKRLSPRYHVEAVQPIDLFPHSYHVEVVARAVLTC